MFGPCFVGNSFSPAQDRCDQIGQFSKVLGKLWFWVKYFVSKVAQMFSYFWTIFKNVPFEIKTDLATFWATFETIWATFNFSI